MAKKGSAIKKTSQRKGTQNSKIKARGKKNSIELLELEDERSTLAKGRTEDGLKISFPKDSFKLTRSGIRTRLDPVVSPADISIIVFDQDGRPFSITYDFLLENRSISTATAAAIKWSDEALGVTAIAAALGPFATIATVGSFLIAAYDFFTKDAKDRKQAKRIIDGVVKQVKVLIDQLAVDLKSYIDDTALNDLIGKLSGAQQVLQDITNDWTSEDEDVRNLTKLRLANLSDIVTIFVIGPLDQMSQNITGNLNLATRATPHLYTAKLLKENVLQYFNNGGRSLSIAADSARSVLDRIPPLLVELRKVSDKQFFDRYDSIKEPGGPIEYYYYYRGAPQILDVNVPSVQPSKALEIIKENEFRTFAQNVFSFENTQNKAIKDILATL
jgi:hypothetical protein